MNLCHIFLIFLLINLSICDYISRCDRPRIGWKLANETLSLTQIVITATVLQITVDPIDNKIETVTVRVRRVFKGFECLDGRKEIAIYGVGEVEVCPRRLLESDTKIFPLVVTSEGFRLRTPLLPINLAVLDALHSLSYGLPHSKRKRSKPALCETSLCPFGSKCVHATGECECRSSCTRNGSTVCGTDRITYASACHLSVTSCLQKKKTLRIASYGPCQKKNPCEDLRCGPGEDCIVNEVHGALQARCLCPQSCPNYGDSVDSSPVCSSNGIDYPSLCHVKQHACQTNTNLTVKYFGKCDPCANFTCSQGTICKLDDRRRPTCRCSQQCSLHHQPVCATDGNTYSNDCVMRVAACKEDINLSIIRNGKCTEKEATCGGLTCSHGSRCQFSSEGIPSCVCPSNCPIIVKPVCGTDGVTYDNECELKKSHCTSKSLIELRHEGTCGIGICASFTGCRSPQVCVPIDDKPTCICPECGDQLREVCANDGRTYPNECKMRRSACLTRTNLYVKYNGICEGCENMKCDFYSSCVSNGRQKAECKCPDNCPINATLDGKNKGKWHSVCGTDGVTYSSECHLRKSACQQNKFIVVAFEGKCDACVHVECRYGQECRGGTCLCSYNCPSSPPLSSRICGENGVLYPSMCHLELAACQKGSPIQEMPPAHCHSAVATFQVRHQCDSSNCLYGGRCSLDSTHCLCTLSCDERDYPQCGSDDACQCNRVGSYGPLCDDDGNCKCRPGVGGPKCNHCLPGFWGIHLIASGALSCQPCGCSAFGSARVDCEQSTGTCECKGNAKGEKCNTCEEDWIMSPSGCVEKDEYRTPTDCSSLKCFHGATCNSRDGSLPDCQCPAKCDSSHLSIAANMSVCGSDGITYDNHCHLQMFACKHQIDLVPIALGICENENDVELHDRSERQKEPHRIGSFCLLPSDCSKLNAICRVVKGKRGRCKCGENMKEENEKCVAIEEIKNEENSTELNLKMTGSDSVWIDIPDLHMYMNMTLSIVLESPSGLIMTSNAESGNFILRVEHRRIVVQFGTWSLYSLESLPLHQPQIIILSWRGRVVSLQSGDGLTSTRVESIDRNIGKLYIAPIDSESIVGCLLNLTINDTPIQKNQINGTYQACDCKSDSCNSNQKISTQSNEQEEVFHRPILLNGKGFLQYPKITTLDVRSIIQVDIRLKPNISDGTVFFWGTVKDGESAGDFIALFLVASQPHFFWNLGSGIAYVKSGPLPSRSWSTVRFGRSLRNGTIYLNGQLAATQMSLPRNMHLDVSGETIYIGGIDQVKKIPEKLRTLHASYEGEIAHLYVNERPFDLHNSSFHNGIISSQPILPCSSSSSEGCFDDSSLDSSFQLRGSYEYSYLNAVNQSLESSASSDISFEFKTKQFDAVLYQESEWSGKQTGDFLILFLQEGLLNLAINLGNDLEFKSIPAQTNKLSDNKWHTIQLKRKERKTQIIIDGKASLTVISTPGSTQLNTNGLVYLGGRSEVSSKFPVKTQFEGCIRSLYLHSRPVHISHHTLSLSPPSLC